MTSPQPSDTARSRSAPDAAPRSPGLLHRLNWPLVCVLSAVALVRPVFSIVGLDDSLGRPVTPLVLAAAISLIWILALGLSRVAEPLATLVAAGVLYALAAIALSGVLSPSLDGHLEGPLANPISIVPLFVVNAIWGGICGVLAIAVRKARGTR